MLCWQSLISLQFYLNLVIILQIICEIVFTDLLLSDIKRLNYLCKVKPELASIGKTELRKRGYQI